jgi:hypothetical protein
VAMENAAPPRRSARIAALIDGELSRQGAMRSRSPSPEEEDDNHLCWLDGGWP